MNGNVAPAQIKSEPDELNITPLDSLKSPSPAQSPTTTAGPNPSIPNPDPSSTVPRVASHASTPDVYSVKSPNAEPRQLHSPPMTRNPLASLQSAKRKRLPQDKVGQLEDRIALDARDADAWLALIGEHQAKGKVSDARNTYERFFKVFPDLVCAQYCRSRAYSRLHNGGIMPIWNLRMENLSEWNRFSRNVFQSPGVSTCLTSTWTTFVA